MVGRRATATAAEDTADDDDGFFVELLVDFGCDKADIVTLFEMVGGCVLLSGLCDSPVPINFTIFT